MTRLLCPGDPEPVGVARLNANGVGKGPWLILVDHAGRAIPARLGRLGLDEADLERHIAWDIGALAVAEKVSAALDAPMIHQRYSRLVIDCNRQLHAADAIPILSEYTPIPANADLADADRLAREQEIHAPYHAMIADVLDRWQGPAPIIVAMHSCTPRYKDQVRTMEIGCLYGDDRRFAGLVLDALDKTVGPTAVDNQPYQVDMMNDYSIPHHAEKRGLAYVEFEIRQDLITDEAGSALWAAKVIQALEAARGEFV